MSLNLDIQSAIRGATKEWKKAKRKADKQDRVSASALHRIRYRPSRYTIRDAAFDVMEAAYNKASSNGRFYANARQIMYAARPEILKRAGEDELNSQYFTQTLLKDYIEQFDPPWKVVWDARGHFIEPYTNKKIGLGGSEVTEYRKKWTDHIYTELEEIYTQIRTVGPANRYNNVLFVEKEGFTEILEDAGIPRRYSMALMSTKGVPVKAACDLIEALMRHSVRVFVVHDFDFAGFKILRTLRKGTRLASGSEVIDLGFRMADIAGLDSEPVTYKQETDPRVYLERFCGVSPEEAQFLVSSTYRGGYSGSRVELNAMSSEELVNWLDSKFAEHGVKKLVPDVAAVIEAYKRAVFLQRLQERIKKLGEELKLKEVDEPEGLHRKVVDAMKRVDTKSWDEAVWELAGDAF